MIEKKRKNGDSKGIIAAVLTDLSKAFDSISLEILFNFYICLNESTETEN